MRTVPALVALFVLGLLLDGAAVWLTTSSAAPGWAYVWAAGWLLLLAGLSGLGLRWAQLQRGARIAWGLLSAWTLASLLLAALPWAQQRWLPPGAPATLTLADDGRTLQWRGALALGDTERLAAQLAQASGLRRIDLQAEGGSLPEALRMAALLRERGLDTRASGACRGACAAVFLGGKRRQLLPEAELGFQRLVAPSLNPLGRWLSLRRQQQLWQTLGLGPGLVQRALLTGAPRWWTPDASDLHTEGSLPALAYPLDLVLPSQPGALPNEYLQALRSHPTWRLLDATLRGPIEQAQGLLVAAHVQGDDAAALLQLHQHAVHLERRLLAGASVEMRDQFLDLQKDRLLALKSDADCRVLLAGDAAVRRRLGAELAQREKTWLEDAAVEPVPTPPSRHVVALDAEVLRKTWNRQGLALLDRLAAPNARVTPLDCQPAIALLTELRGLQAAQRKPAQRRLFD